MKYLVTIVALLNYITNISCLKLLLVFPPPIKSHYILGNALGKGLAKAGHQVTMISPFTEKNPPINFKEILLYEDRKSDDRSLKIDRYQMESKSAVSTQFSLTNMGCTLVTRLFEHPEIQKLLKSDEHFDAVVMDAYFNDAIQIFAHHFKAPLIAFCTIGPTRLVNNLVGNPQPPSYIPDTFLSFDENMNFRQRMYNFLFGVFSDLHFFLSLYPRQNAIMKKYFPNAPDLRELQNNVSLVLLNSHESVNQPVPHVPNMIAIGGFHVNPPKELSKDLKGFMDKAADGVIYFSMGSTLATSEMPKDKKEDIIRVLGSRKEKVLLKWEEDTLENKPDNMMISKWLPQQSILAHSNCKLFISHGGLLSTTEAVYFGVPILAIPIFGDQKLNAARAASLGYSKTLPFSQITKQNLAEVLNEMLINPNYLENVKQRSEIMNDRPVKPMDLAIYWIEYVVRHKGAPHLRVAANNLPLYKYYMLDIIGIAIAVLISIKYLLSKICRCMFFSKEYTPEDTNSNVKRKKKRE